MTAAYAKDAKLSDGQALALAKTLAAASGVLVGGGGNNVGAVNAAATTGANAAENNYLAHAAALRLSKLLDQQLAGNCGPSCVQDIKDLRTLDKESDKALAQACANPSSKECSLELSRVVVVAKTYVGKSDGLDQFGVVGNEHAKANTLEEQYTKRVNNAATYNAITGATNALTKAAIAPAELAFNIGRAAAGDKAMQAQLGDMVKGMGNFVSAPIDTTTQTIKNTLDRANQLEAAGQVDAAQQMRSELVTNGLLVVTGAGTLAVKGTEAAVNLVNKVSAAIDDAKAASAAVAKATIDNNFYTEGNPIDLGKSVVQTNPNEAIFWSGRTNGVGGIDIAKQIANKFQGKTLESLLESRQITMPLYDPTVAPSVQAWVDISTELAKNAIGEVRAVLGSQLRPQNIWETYELPALKANPNVTRITSVDPATGKVTVIYERSATP